MATATTRRELLAASLAAGGGALLAGCAARSGPAAAPTPRPPVVAGPTRPAKVFAVRGHDLVKMTRRVLEDAGGISSVVKPGDRVFLKPNMVTLPWASTMFDPFRSGECTKPEVVAAVAEACLEAGAAEVTIGDGSQRPEFSWAGARFLDGSTDLEREAKRLAARHARPVRLACLDRDTPEWIDVPTRLSMGTVAVSSLVMRADKVISIPVAKTHRWAWFTLSIKNFIGVTPLARYGWGSGGRLDRFKLHWHDNNPRDFNRLAQDLARAVGPDLAVVDMSIGMEGDGPSRATGGTPLDVATRAGSWAVLASTDLVAADATTARVMSQEEARIQEVLSAACEEGMGALCAGDIELLGASLPELRIPWRAARPANG
jgi:uncharacterized protein (DUF362 family)